jgi:lipoate synthase|tara:strand:+ start:140 stop:313 length:174 start_codon:yes stop_codon:yes gene_type:complete
MSESNKWFRDKWNRFDKLKQIEDSWFDVFNENVENELLRRHLEIDKKVNYGRSKKSK